MLCSMKPFSLLKGAKKGNDNIFNEQQLVHDEAENVVFPPDLPSPGQELGSTQPLTEAESLPNEDPNLVLRNNHNSVGSSPTNSGSFSPATTIPSTESDPIISPMESPLEPKKTSRIARPPAWLQDYVTNKKFSGKSLYPLADYLSYDSLSPAYIAYLTAFLAAYELKFFHEAAQYKLWVKSM